MFGNDRFRKVFHWIFILISLALVVALLVPWNLLQKDTPAKKETPVKTPKKNNDVTRVVQSGESIYGILTEMGITPGEVGRIAYFLGEQIDVTSIQIGDTLTVKFRETPQGAPVDSTASEDDALQFERLIYKPDMITSHIITNMGDTLAYALKQLPVDTKRRLLSGVIKNTLDAALSEVGLQNNEKQQVNSVLETEINFQTEARRGDVFKVYIEERYYKTIRLPRAKILYVSYEGERAKYHEGFRFDDLSEDSALNGMYSATGKTLIHNSVRTPLDRMHVTSKFGYRIHPLTGRWAMHQGIDYRGSYGTPVYAVAAGVVTLAGWNGGFGKEVRIKHDANLTTNYGHLASIGVRKGQKVAKGAKIGTVGSTGVSSGPHLHFGLLSKGRWINPANLKMVGAVELSGDKMASFTKQRDILLAELARVDLEPRVSGYSKRGR